jgi:hypothetical protein
MEYQIALISHEGENKFELVGNIDEDTARVIINFCLTRTFENMSPEQRLEFERKLSPNQPE